MSGQPWVQVGPLIRPNRRDETVVRFGEGGPDALTTAAPLALYDIGIGRMPRALGCGSFGRRLPAPSCYPSHSFTGAIAADRLPRGNRLVIPILF